MDTEQTLSDYLARYNEAKNASWRERPTASFEREKPKPSPRQSGILSVSNRSNRLQLFFRPEAIHQIPDLDTFWMEYLRNPRAGLEPAFKAVDAEFREAEKIYNTTLLNSSVVSLGRKARQHLEQARSCWESGKITEAFLHADQALHYQIDYLIAAYQRIAAEQVIESRDLIELHNWTSIPSRLERLHSRARGLYETGTYYRKNNQADDARRLFLQTLDATRAISLEVYTARELKNFLRYLTLALTASGLAGLMLW